jgi:4-hydroxy-tetrahydrodipicolinate synthase
MSDNPKSVSGVLPVFHTPFHEDESLDLDTLAAEIDWIFRHGADGVVFAMVSELLRLSETERETVTRSVCALARGRGVTVISVGAETSRLAAHFARQAADCGADALMAIPPVATRALAEELGDYYRRILAATPLPLIVQDASGYVGQPMSIAFQAALLDEFGPDRVWFKPEAAPIGPRLSELRDATRGRARVFEGTGGLALVDSFRRGIAGTIPGADLVRAIVPLWQALQAGDWDLATRIHGPLASLVSLQTSLDGFLAVEKHLLVRQGVFPRETVRGPRGFRLDPETRREVDRLFDLLLAAAAS